MEKKYLLFLINLLLFFLAFQIFQLFSEKRKAIIKYCSWIFNICTIMILKL